MNEQSDHRLGVSEVNLVVRHLKLTDPETEKIEGAVNEIDHLFGLDGVSFDAKSEVLNLAYDGARISLEDIESILTKYQIEVSHDWWTQLKESFYKYVDDNVRDNAQRQIWSCHQSQQPKTDLRRHTPLNKKK